MKDFKNIQTVADFRELSHSDKREFLNGEDLLYHSPLSDIKKESNRRAILFQEYLSAMHLQS